MRVSTWTRFVSLLVAVVLAGCESAPPTGMKGQPAGGDPGNPTVGKPGGPQKPIAK